MLSAVLQTSSEEQASPVNGNQQKTSPEEEKQSRNGTQNSNEDDLFENLPLSAVATVDWITEQCIVTHVMFQKQKFEVLDVKADGNCFYSMISVETVKRNIFSHMQDLWEAKSRWFKTLYSQFAPVAFHENFDGYVKHMLQDREWANMLERDIASDFFKCNILMHTPATNARLRSLYTADS